MRTVAWLVLLTLVPTLELRASIPYGIVDSELSAPVVIAICIVANVALAPLVWLFVDRGLGFFLRVAWIERLYERIVGRARERLHPYVERWGTFGLALFIGVPLPGSGVYSGALGAYLLGFDFRRYMLASVAGVVIAGAVVSAVMLSGTTALGLFLKH